MNRNRKIISLAILSTILMEVVQPQAVAVQIGLGNAVAKEGAKVVDKAASPLPSCGGQMTLFTQAPVTDPNLVNLTPLGSQSSHILPPDHMYFNYLNNTNSSQKLYAPSDGWVIQVTQEIYSSGLPTSYFIGFSPCREVILNFLGIPSLTPEIQTALTAPSSRTSCSPSMTAVRRSVTVVLRT